MLYPSLVLALLAAVCLSEKNQRHLLPLFVQVTTLDHVTTPNPGTFGGGRQHVDNQAKEHFTCRQNQTGQIIIPLITRHLSATARIGLCVASALQPPRPHGLPPHLRHYCPPPASACARHPFYITTRAAATAVCGPGAEMSLAYATGPFSVPNCPARPSRTTEGPILYGAVGAAAT